MNIFLGVLFVIMCVCSFYIHNFQTLLHNAIVLTQEKTVMDRACSFDKKFVVNSTKFFTYINTRIVSIWCPILIGASGLLLTDWILHYKGYTSMYLDIIVSCLVSSSLMLFLHTLKLYRFAQTFATYVVVAYYVNLVEDIKQQWIPLTKLTDEQLTKEDLLKANDLIKQHTAVMAFVSGYYHITDDPIIREQIKKSCIPLSKIH